MTNINNLELVPSDACLSLIKTFEGLSTTAYVCPAGVWTIGYGHTKDVKKGDVITQAGAEQLLQQDVKVFARQVINVLHHSINQNQFDALVAFAFNVGIGNLKSSTLLKKINIGDFKSAAQEFLKWNKARDKSTGEMKTHEGLTRRRQAEKRLFECEEL